MRLKIGRFIILLIFFLVGTFLFFKHPLYSLNEPASIIAIPAKGWITPNTNKLLARNKLVGNFKSPYNNLGIVAVNFTNGGKIVDDQVSFRIKEKGAKKWYYQNLYKTDQFQDRAFFPFGFPEIKNSVGREFTFEIESIKGTERSAIFLNKDNLTFLSKYKLDKSNPVAFFILKLTSSVDFKILLIQLFIALILTYVFSFLSFRKLKFKEIKLSLPAEIGLIVLLSFITILYLYSDNLKASLGLIDDHWIMFFLGPDKKVYLNEIPNLLMKTEVGQFGYFERFRPSYYTLQIIETFLWRDNAFGWYFSRIILFTFSLSIFIFLLRKKLGLLLAYVFSLYILTYSFWADIWARLGPGEIYAVFGTSLFALGFVNYYKALIAKRKDNRIFNPNSLLIFIGFLISAGSKENFLILILPIMYLMIRQIKLKKFNLDFGLNILTILFSFFVGSAIVLAIGRSGHDIYQTQVNTPGKFNMLVTGTKLFIKKFKVLYFASFAVLSIYFIPWKKERGSLKYYPKYIKQVSLCLGAFLILFVSQYVFYSGVWPSSIRYDFPGMLVEPFIILLYAWLGLFFLQIFINKSFKDSHLKLILGALFIFLVFFRGFSPIRAAVKVNRIRTNDFNNKYRLLVETINKNKGALVFESYSLWDYEPIFALQRYLAASNIRRPMYLIIHGYEKSASMSQLERDLVGELTQSSQKGSSKNFNFMAIEKFKEGESCISIVFSQKKQNELKCPVANYIL